MKQYKTYIISIIVFFSIQCHAQLVYKDTVIVRNTRDSIVRTLLKDSSMLEYFYSDGVLNHFKSWYVSGEIELENYYTNGVIQTSIGWYKSGRIKWIMKYDEKGKRNGIQSYYYENGNIKSESFYSNGFECGLWKDWYSNGALKEIQEFNYNPDEKRKCQHIEIIVENIDEETWELIQKKLTYCLPFNGVYKKYNDNNKLIIDGQYLFGKKNKNWKYYNDKGVLIKEEVYNDNGKLIETKKY